MSEVGRWKSEVQKNSKVRRLFSYFRVPRCRRKKAEVRKEEGGRLIIHFVEPLSSQLPTLEFGRAEGRG